MDNNGENDQVAHLREIVQQAIVFGDLRMKDGTKTNYYINGHAITTDPGGLFLAATFMLDILYSWGIEGVCGEVTGASNLIGAILLLSFQAGQPLKGFHIYKSVQDSNRMKVLIPSLPTNFPVAIVDDVSSSGSTALRCQKILLAEGAQVRGFISIVDRMRGARQKIEAAGMGFQSILSVADFAEYVLGMSQRKQNGKDIVGI